VSFGQRREGARRGFVVKVITKSYRNPNAEALRDLDAIILIESIICMRF
jgi:hypothetical protein